MSLQLADTLPSHPSLAPCITEDDFVDPSDTDASLDHIYFKWLQEHGFEVGDSIRIRHVKGRGRAVVASRDIQKGELLFKVPKEGRLGPATSSLKDSLKKWPQEMDDNSLNGEDHSQVRDLSDWSRLAICLMYEFSLGEESTFHPYLQVLPCAKSLHSLPLWTNSQREPLRDLAVFEQIGDGSIRDMFESEIAPFISYHSRKIAAAFKDGGKHKFTQEWSTFEAFVHVGCLIGAYAFSFKQTVMCPLADTLNHRTGYNNARLSKKSGIYGMRAICPIKKGQEIYNTYGELPNDELLRRYGFIDTPNPHSTTTIPASAILEAISAAMHQADGVGSIEEPGGWETLNIEHQQAIAEAARVLVEEGTLVDPEDMLGAEEGKEEANLHVSDCNKTFISTECRRVDQLWGLTWSNRRFDCFDCEISMMESVSGELKAILRGCASNLAAASCAAQGQGMKKFKASDGGCESLPSRITAQAIYENAVKHLQSRAKEVDSRLEERQQEISMAQAEKDGCSVDFHRTCLATGLLQCHRGILLSFIVATPGKCK